MQPKYTLIEKVKQNIGLGLGLTVIGSSIGLVGFTGIKVYQKLKNTTYISVKGAAGIPVRADMASWSLTVNTKGKDLIQGSTLNSKHTQMIYDYLISTGFTPEEIVIEAVVPHTNYKRKYVQVSPTYTREENTAEVLSYDFYRTITINTKRLEVVSKSYEGVSALLSQGIDLNIEKPAYRVSDIETKKLAVLKEAIRNAHLRAQLFTGLDDSKSLELSNAQSSVFQITRPEAEASDYGYYDTSTVDKVARTVVTVTFKLS